MATRPPSTAARAPAFAEAPAWQPVAEGWRPLFGSFQELGFSFEWHDFQLDQPLDWAKSFHPGSIELCLNVAGTARLNDGQQEQQLAPRSLAFYHVGEPPPTAIRPPGERHQFITVPLVGCSPFYLSRIFSQEIGLTLQQYLRQIRLERAEELLRTGQCNVTEAAFEVGYNSLSHFSTAFHGAFGCCPGLYPLKTRPTPAAARTPPPPAA